MHQTFVIDIGGTWPLAVGDGFSWESKLVLFSIPGKSNFIRFSWWRRIILICAAYFNRHFPQGISKGLPLRHAFRIFPRERKDTAVWSAELHEGKVCRNLILGQCVKCFRFFPTLKFYQTFCFVGLCRPHWHWLFFYEKSQQKRIQEEVSSWISPQGQSNLQKSFEEWNFSSILGGNDIKLCFYRI